MSTGVPTDVSRAPVRTAKSRISTGFSRAAGFGELFRPRSNIRAASHVGPRRILHRIAVRAPETKMTTEIAHRTRPSRVFRGKKTMQNDIRIHVRKHVLRRFLVAL